MKRQYGLMERGKDESTHTYFSRIDKLVNEMKNNGEKIAEKVWLKKFYIIKPFWLYGDDIEESRDINTTKWSTSFHQSCKKYGWMKDHYWVWIALKTQIKIKIKMELLLVERNKIGPRGIKSH